MEQRLCLAVRDDIRQDYVVQGWTPSVHRLLSKVTRRHRQWQSFLSSAHFALITNHCSIQNIKLESGTSLSQMSRYSCVYSPPRVFLKTPSRPDSNRIEMVLVRHLLIVCNGEAGGCRNGYQFLRFGRYHERPFLATRGLKETRSITTSTKQWGSPAKRCTPIRTRMSEFG